MIKDERKYCKLSHTLEEYVEIHHLVKSEFSDEEHNLCRVVSDLYLYGFSF